MFSFNFRYFEIALTENKIVAEQRTFLTEKNSNRNVIPTNNSISFSSMILSDFLFGRMKKMLTRPSANAPISSRKRSMRLYGVFSVATYVAFVQWCKCVYAFGVLQSRYRTFSNEKLLPNRFHISIFIPIFDTSVCVFFCTSLIIFYQICLFLFFLSFFSD